MRRVLSAILLAALAVALAAAPARAEFGLHDLRVEFTAPEGKPPLQAGSHPLEFINEFEVNTVGNLGTLPDGQLRNLTVELPEGLVGSPDAVRQCSTADFLTTNEVVSVLGGSFPDCPNSSALGVVEVRGSVSGSNVTATSPVYNLAPPPGAAMRLGFLPIVGVRVVVDAKLNESPPHNVIAEVRNITQMERFISSKMTLFGNPASPEHDGDRGICGATVEGGGDLGALLGIKCEAGANRPFLTLPRSCPGQPLPFTFEALSWQGDRFAETVHTDDPVHGCEELGFGPDLSAQPTTRSASAATGLDVELEIADEGLTEAEGRAESDIKKAVVTLPEGMTINPSQAEGLGVCTESQLARESAGSPFGAGCPGESKIGDVAVRTPLLEDTTLRGSVFVAEPYRNRFGTLLAIFMTIKEPRLGIAVKLAGRVEPDPETGQIVTSFDDLPQLPFSHFRFRFREGARSPLITPEACGSYTIDAEFTPWADPNDPLPLSSSFEISSGAGGGPCPAGAAPFEPGFSAGTISNAAGGHSPFFMRLTRRDGDQDLTRFDAVLPPGVTAKLAGVPWCPEAAIARARGRDGKDELASPSCPLASQVGAVQGGAGVGSQLTYVPGRVYLAGPVGGAPISVVGIVPAVAGPFDVGTIVVRQALDLDPITGQARVVSAASDELPHILAGIPLKVRDIQVSVNRPNFTLNPTSCKPMAVLAGIWGGGEHVFSAADDFPVLRSARFQAAGCRGLGFKPKLAIKLKGGVKRGANPALRAHVVPRPGDANFSRAVVTLPRSAFLEQAHIRTICTRVQFAAGPGHGALCPKGARYGFARAWSPLLDGPVSGPVYLRSSDNNLPDLVAALSGPPSAAVQVELAARIDSVKGGIRSIFTGIPDLPVSRFILDMQGGKKGLIVNSRHLCHKPGRNRARANLRGQNGRISKTKPRVIAVACKKRRAAPRGGHRRR